MKVEDNKTFTEEIPVAPIFRSEKAAAVSRRNGSRPTEVEDLLQQVEALQTRLYKLSEASRRVSEDIDLNVVLQEVIDNARHLTGARYGALLTYEQSGDIQEFITSGLSPDEIQLLKVSPQGLGLLGHMNEVREPLRLANIASHPSSVGFPENHPPMKTFLGMPVRHRGEHVGNIYLTEKGGGHEFTSEDEAILVMFASQAGAAIVNARRYREEYQARANLEALLALTPVGMFVVDAETRMVESVNKEAERITGVGAGVSLEEFRNRATYSLPDGRELPIERHPLQAALRGLDSIQAEVVVFHAPGGLETTCLVNAKAIHSEQGELVSAVGTLFDITPLEDLKSQRAEFLQNLSHELRTPLTSIKGSATTVLSSPYSLESTEVRQLFAVVDEQSDRMRQIINDLVDLTQIESGTLSVNPEPANVADLLNQARGAHINAGEANTYIELDLPVDLPRVMADKLRIIQVLGNLITNTASYSSKLPTVKISASPRDLFVAFTVIGQSPDDRIRHQSSYLPESLPREAAGNLGTRNELRIAICEGIVEAHGGRLSVEDGDSTRGSEFTFTLPVVDESAYLAEPESIQSPSPRDLREGQARILAACHNADTRRYIRSSLSDAGLDAVAMGDPSEAEWLIEEHIPHVILLEPALPWDEGFETLVRVGRVSDAPVIVVAGPGRDLQIRRAFELGAFDYIAKPFTSTELIARVNVALKRGSPAGWTLTTKRYTHGDLAIDFRERKVSVAGRPVHLTATEYKLLAELATAGGRVLTHEQLLRRVWGPQYSSDLRIVRQYVKELRHKLRDDASRPSYIYTELGVGYRMAKPSP
ncbi:MAG: winged helix-turn-helix domain-containing protein [Chloroflexi bacterium]|nr:winged helix-turn-helix domain-containing protein [Chloroflexota bacterium]